MIISWKSADRGVEIGMTEEKPTQEGSKEEKEKEKEKVVSEEWRES